LLFCSERQFARLSPQQNLFQLLIATLSLTTPQSNSAKQKITSAASGNRLHIHRSGTRMVAVRAVCLIAIA